MDGLAMFVRHFPGWTGPDGYPLSWRHYLYGLSYISRERARHKLAAADVLSVEHMKPADRRRWLQRHEIQGE